MNAGRGAVRAAEALLRGAGGRTVQLRLPAPAIAGDLGEQVGLGVPQFEDYALAPVLFRKLRASSGKGAAHVRASEAELLVSAAAVAEIVGSTACDSASVLFATAAGVLVDGDLWTITGATAMQAFGEVLLWRLGLEGRAALAL